MDPLRDAYFEVYFYMVYCFYKAGTTKVGASKADINKAVTATAERIAQFEKDWPDLGGSLGQEKFKELLATEAALRAKYEIAKKKFK
jgi:hypothetical protein